MIPTKAQVVRLFEEYTKAVIMDELSEKEIAKMKSAYQNAYTIRTNFKLAGGTIEREEN